MKQNRLKRLKITEWILHGLMLIVLIGIFVSYWNLKNALLQIVGAVLMVMLTISVAILRKEKLKEKIVQGRLKVYGQKKGLNFFTFASFVMGGSWLVWAYLAYQAFDDLNEFIMKCTLGIGMLLPIMVHWSQFYLEINKERIRKIDSSTVRIDEITSITISNHEIDVKSKFRSVNILLSKLNETDQKQLILDIEELAIKHKLEVKTLL